METLNTLPSLALWSGVAIGLGAIFAAWLTRTTKISEFRQAWINDLRKDIADFMGVAERWIRKWDELNTLELIEERNKRIEKEAVPIANEARIILYRIQLRFNPRPNKYKEEDDAFLDSLLDLLDPQKLIPDQLDSSWHNLAKKSIERGRELLKREWEVTKKWRKK